MLRKLSTYQIFVAATSGPVVFHHVDLYVKALSDAAMTGPSPGDLFGRLPMELACAILATHLTFEERLPFGRTSSRNRFLMGLVIRERFAVLLAQYNLQFHTIQFLFVATGCLLSGSAIPSVMTDTRFEPHDLDFYTAHGTGLHVMQFLRLTGALTERRKDNAYNRLPGVSTIWTLDGSTAGRKLKINLIKSTSSNPRETVLLFHSTAVFGYLDRQQLWHGYPALTFDSETITTPLQLPLPDELLTHQRAWDVLNKYTERVFRFGSEYEPPHYCGRHWSCPLTVRGTDDGGSLRAPIPQLPLSPRGFYLESAWTLGGGICSRRISANQSVTGIRDRKWFATFAALLRASVRPEDVLDYMNMPPISP
ncbi:hypothetical protein C8J57DRAFT_1505978 [Mycena rebaudengoi]|nr:hypothetical protein C8J57DRAFT_1505978 [Mycena rebaudengoi]